VIRARGLAMRYGSKRIFDGLELDVERGGFVLVTGPNGSGKTTLLHALLGDVPLAEGRRWVGPGVTIGTMDQARAGFATDAVLIDAFTALTGLDATAARSLLAKFALGADHVGRQVGHLSPGERSRAELAALMGTGVNCLVLDEPTNHLDLAAIEQLEHALAGYRGTFVIATHDRRLLETIGITRTIGFGGDEASPGRA